MGIKIAILLLVTVGFPVFVLAGEHEHKHGAEIHHAMNLQIDGGLNNHSDAVMTWDMNGWIGTDENRVVLKSEGERKKGETETAEFWGMYNRMMTTFWDGQVGLRHDTQPISTSYVAIGVAGLAPYFIETEAHLFMSEHGDISARLKQERELIITHELVLKPYIEANIYAQDIPKLNVGAGLSDAEIGFQARCECTHGSFMPYIDIRYDHQFGETAHISKSLGHDTASAVFSLGLDLSF